MENKALNLIRSIESHISVYFVQNAFASNKTINQLMVENVRTASRY